MSSEGKVLVVDDIDFNLDILEQMLGREGFEVLTAGSGNDALNILSRAEVEIILLDIMMPRMDGFELLTILKENEDYSKIPVIMVTAKTDVDSLVMAFNKGAYDYIKKPYDQIELVTRVKAALALKRAKDSQASQARELSSSYRRIQSTLSEVRSFTEAANFALQGLDDEVPLPADSNEAVVRELAKVFGQLIEVVRRGRRMDD